MNSSEGNEDTKSNKSEAGDLASDHIQMERNLGYGSSVAALLVLLTAISLDTSQLTVQISISCLAISIPLFLLLGSLNEAYIVLGPKTYEHYKTALSEKTRASTLVLAGLAFFISILLIFYHVSVVASIIFLTISAIAVIIGFVFQSHIEKHI